MPSGPVLIKRCLLLFRLTIVQCKRSKPCLVIQSTFFQSFCLPSMALHNSDLLGKSYRQEEIQHVKELLTILQVNMHFSKNPKNV